RAIPASASWVRANAPSRCAPAARTAMPTCGHFQGARSSFSPKPSAPDESLSPKNLRACDQSHTAPQQARLGSAPSGSVVAGNMESPLMPSFLRSIPSRIATALVGYVLVILVAGAWGGTALANAGEDSEDSFPLACAARDLDLVTLIELQGEAEVIAPSRLADAYLTLLQAR